MIFETASALVLLVGAGLLINSFVRLLNVPPGFEPEGVVIARTAMPPTRYPKAERSKAVYSRVGKNNDNFFIFCGEDIFVFTRTPAGFLFTEVGVND